MDAGIEDELQALQALQALLEEELLGGGEGWAIIGT